MKTELKKELPDMVYIIDSNQDSLQPNTDSMLLKSMVNEEPLAPPQINYKVIHEGM